MHVADVNDCRPVFDSDVYHVLVAENEPPRHRPLIQLLAVDADAPGGPNSQLTYYVRSRADGYGCNFLSLITISVQVVLSEALPLLHYGSEIRS